MKKLVLIVLFAVCCGNMWAGKEIKRPDSYNYLRGLEAMQNEDVAEALDYFEKDIQDYPKNGYSYSWIAYLRCMTEDNGRALTAANKAIKFLPKKDGEYLAFAYATRAEIFLNLEDTTKALADYSTAIKIKSEEISFYESRAQIYYEQGKYDLADADYHRIITLDGGNTLGYMGIGRDAVAQERWEEAVKQFNYVIKLDDNYAKAYSFRAEAYLGMEQWDKATDDIVAALTINMDEKARKLAYSLHEPAFSILISKLKLKAKLYSDTPIWPILIASLYEDKKQYEQAIDYYEKTNEIEIASVAYQHLSSCYYKMGQYAPALSNINKALQIDSTDISSIGIKAKICIEMGLIPAAIEEADKILSLQPESDYGYYQRGWFKMQNGNYSEAIEDLSMVIMLVPQVSLAYCIRGSIYNHIGKTDLAQADFRKVIELEENKPDEYDQIPFAYHYSGENDKAIAAMERIIARDTTNEGSYYDAACLYALMQDKENAIRYLKKSLELGYNQFVHIERDYDLDFIRETEEFKELIQQYRKRTATQQQADTAQIKTEYTSITEIPFSKEDGVCKVRCQINGLPLHFVFDTGASDVTLSMVEANFMMKNNYLTPNDVIGDRHYMDANGNVSVGTLINLRNVNLGDLNLNNVRASVVRNQKAPLLLGQSVLNRLGKIEIDNKKNIIRISQFK